MTARVVADASVVISMLTDATHRGERATDALRGVALVAPALLPFEVVQTIRRHVLDGRLPERDAVRCIDELGNLAIELIPFAVIAERAWELRENLTIYDASYVALAEALEIRLITEDARMAGAPGLRCEVVVPA